MKVGINCGHTLDGQPGSGAVGRISESAETRNVGKALMRLFKEGGHSVVDCTDDYASSESENLREIVRLANAQKLDLFISVHFNSGGGKGVEVFTYGGKKFSEAENVCKSIAALGFKNRGVKNGSNLYVIKNTVAKAMLIEVCFVDTDDADLYKSVGYEKVAKAIYTAITGKSAEYSSAGEIVRGLKNLGIISNEKLWLDYCERDSNVYWLMRKSLQYCRSH